ncbi:response regulator [Cohnella thailandensis]|uniref:Response regulator transcription factor n=1 Tax=Cohnella thailandensis TaxID=557557 RepID=A0A841T2L2_9BACL|nr:response regulator [Cohnella thailandensis]MBB6636608.1 response regulator transcription factor [Cohnella thailandensis]MBP1973518.1 two-component system response regulator YesN [Cohnella thailandensis]
MLKALVFDDEYIVLEGLRRMIDWEAFGIELAGMAGDGPAALELFLRVRPQLVLTDINMPGMDGLQLIRSILDVAPDTYCIVFSGYNEYEYVKRAIQIGVSDYLEKPLEVENIEEALKKAIGQIQKRNETQAIKQSYEESRNVLFEKITLELILGKTQALPKWKDQLGLHADSIAGLTVLACSEEITLDNRPDCHFVSIRNGEEHLVLLLHRILPTQELWEEIDQEAEKRSLTVGSGRTKADPHQLADSYQEARRALRCARFLHQLGRVGFEDLGELITSPEPLSEREEAIILCLRAGNYSGLMEHLQPFMDWIQSELVAPEVVEREMVKLLYLALEAVKESPSSSRNEPFAPHIEIRNIHGRDQMLAWFRGQFERIVHSALELRENTKYSAVEQAQLYIENNLSQDLSLQEVARHVGMNPSYLSVLFKEVTGETYIKFLTRFRMELAKKWLLEGMKVSEVSEKVGYLTYRHFSEVFKKHTGLSPGQFKDRVGPTER